MTVPWDGLPSHGVQPSIISFFLDGTMGMEESRNPMKFTFILMALVSSVVPCFAQERPETLTTLRDSYEGEILAAIDPLKIRYLDKLHSLKLKYTQSGSLDGALAVDAEIKRIENDGNEQPSSSDAAPPEDLAALRKIYISAVSKAAEPLSDKYIESLQLLRVKFTQLGQLDEAVAVDNELKLRIKLQEAASPKSNFPIFDTNKLADLKWRMPEKLLPGTESNRQWVQFSPNGRLICEWNTANFNWKVAEDGNILFYPYKNRKKAVKFEWDNQSPTATISTDDSSHKVTQFRR
jgi:hypothetical protein